MSKMSFKVRRKQHKKKTPWPLFFLFGGGLLIVLATVLAFNKPSQPKAAIEVSGSPSLKVDQQKVDLGDVKLGQTVTVSFQLMNVGDQTLRFSQRPYIEVKEGC